MATLSTIALHPGAIGEIALGEFLDVPAGGDATITVDAIVSAIFAKQIAPGVTFQVAIATIYAHALSAQENGGGQFPTVTEIADAVWSKSLQ